VIRASTPRALVLLAFLAAWGLAQGCGFSGDATGSADSGFAGADGKQTLPDGAPLTAEGGGPTDVPVGGPGDAAVEGSTPKPDASGIACPAPNGGFYCSSKNACVPSCGDNDNCTLQPNSCFSCPFGAGPPQAVCVAASCAPSLCPCTAAKDCGDPNEACISGVCTRCSAGTTGKPCKNGRSCLQCDGGGYSCAPAPDQC
jgi:hypothetical protein